MRRHTLPVLCLVVLLTAAGCGLSTGTGGGDDGLVVRVYSARTYGSERAFESFTKATGAKVSFLNGSDAELRERLETEGDRTKADVYLTVDAANLALAAQQDLLQPISSPELDRVVPTSLRDPQHRWYALAVRARTFIYNPDKVQPADLTTYAALAEPKWKGRLCMRGATSTYTQSLVASLIAHEGQARAAAIVAGWVANGVQILNNDVEIVETVAAGGCDVGLTNHYYLARELEKDPGLNVKLKWANQQSTGVHLNISGGGVTKHADNPDLGQKFLEWLATEGQQLLVGESKEFPVNADAARDPVVAGLGPYKADTLNVGQLGTLNAAAVRLLRDAGYQ